MRSAALWRLSATLVLTLAVTGCGKPWRDASNAQSNESAAVDIGDGGRGVSSGNISASSATSETPAVLDESPAAIVARLTAPGAVAIPGLAANGPMTCSEPTSADAWAAHCLVSVDDGERGSARIAFDVYARDLDFETAKKQLQAKISRPGDAFRITNESSYTVTDKKVPSRNGRVPEYCHQSVGTTRSYAVCLILARPRVLLVAIVSPVAEGNSATRDTEHASDIAGRALVGMYGKL